MHYRRLPHPAAGGEVAGYGRAQRHHRHCEGHDAQRAHRACIAYPQKADHLRSASQKEKCRRSEHETVDKAAAHGGAYAVGTLMPELLGNEPRRRESHSRYGKGRAQNRHDKLIKPYPGRAYASGKPHLKRHRDETHDKRGASQQCGIHN